MSDFTHFNEEGLAKMVDVSNKDVTVRYAKATGKILMNELTLNKIYDNTMKKGNVLGVAQVGGIMGLKQTSNLIPMAHNINILSSDISFVKEVDGIRCYCEAKTKGTTGIEMEVIVGVNIALATIYDMAKAVDKDMVITDIKLLEKTGGKSGHYVRGEEDGKSESY